MKGYRDIEGGDRVTIVTRHGSRLTGRAVMHGPGGWVLNLGGAHGTPGIATLANTVKVVKATGTAGETARRNAWILGGR